jgi:hypothetical protein
MHMPINLLFIDSVVHNHKYKKEENLKCNSVTKYWK